MPTIAQNEFRTRQNIDGRQFNTWYDNNDVERIVWALHQGTPPTDIADCLPPYVFFDSENDFEVLITAIKAIFMESNKTYFPFIIKPEVGAAHYMAGFLRKNSEAIQSLPVVTVFLFNPTGCADKERVKKRLNLASAEIVSDMPLILSPHVVQSESNDGGRLVSCGPLCVEFVRNVLSKPLWRRDLDEQFLLPDQLKRLIGAKQSNYQKKIIAMRASHDKILGSLANIQLNLINDFNDKMTEKIFGLERLSVHGVKGEASNILSNHRAPSSQAPQDEDEDEDDYDYDYDCRAEYYVDTAEYDENEMRKMPSVTVSLAREQPTLSAVPTVPGVYDASSTTPSKTMPEETRIGNQSPRSNTVLPPHHLPCTSSFALQNNPTFFKKNGPTDTNRSFNPIEKITKERSIQLIDKEEVENDTVNWWWNLHAMAAIGFASVAIIALSATLYAALTGATMAALSIGALVTITSTLASAYCFFTPSEPPASETMPIGLSIASLSLSRHH